MSDTTAERRGPDGAADDGVAADVADAAADAGLGMAVVGAGVIGHLHAATIARLEGARLVAVVDVDKKRADKLAGRHGAVAYADVREALNDSRVGALAVCTPSGLHAESVLAALSTGRHVMVEKPLDVTPAAVAAVRQAVEKTGLTLSVVSQHRFDPASVAVHRAISQGRLGAVGSGVVSMPWWRTQAYYDSGEWRGTMALDGGGALMNQAIHTVDLMVWMMGRPVQVFARTARLAHQGIEVEDTVVATVAFENGALGVIHATTSAYPGLPARLQIHADRGSAVIEGDRLVWFNASDTGGGPDYGNAGENQADSLLAELAPGPPSTFRATAASDPSALSDAHALQYADFIEAVREGRPPAVTAEDAARTLEVIWAVYSSAAEGRPIDLPG